MKSLEENLAAAETAIRAVKTRLTRGASNRRSDRLAQGGGIDQVYDLLHNHTAHHKLTSANSTNVSNSVGEKAAFFISKAEELLPKKPSTIDKSLQNGLSDSTLINAVENMRKTYTWPTPPQAIDIGNIMDVRDAAWFNRCGNCHEQSCCAYYDLYMLLGYKIDCIDLMTFANNDYDHVWVVIGRVNESDPKNLSTWGDTAVWCDPWQNDGIAFAVQDLVKGKVLNLDAIYKCNTPELIANGKPIVFCRDGSLPRPLTPKLDPSRFALFNK